MIYLDKTEMPIPGRTKFWRMFADTPEELRAAMKDAGAAASAVEHGGEVNEFAILTTSQKNKIKGATEIDDRGKVALFRRKKANPPKQCPGADMIEEAEFEEALDEAEIEVVDGMNPDRWGPNGEDRFDFEESDEDE